MGSLSSGWPVEFRGVTESVVATRQLDGAWNVAALGLFPGDPVTARTWGETRTKQNFDREAGGVIQFVRDPIVFVTAALDLLERDEPMLPSADAWVDVTVERIDTGTTDGTPWVEWALYPDSSAVLAEYVPIISRGFNAVIEASVIVSRLNVDVYDRDASIAYLEYLRTVVDRCGSEADQAAFDRLEALTDLSG